MAYKPWIENLEEQDMTSHISFLTGQTIGELFNGAHLYAMKCRKKYAKKLCIQIELNVWYNCLKQIYIATATILGNDGKGDIEALEKDFNRYFDEGDKKPSARTMKLHIRVIEHKCIDILSNMQMKLTETLQNHHAMFFRMRPKPSTESMPISTDDMIKQLKKAGYNVSKKTNKHDKLHPRRLGA